MPLSPLSGLRGKLYALALLTSAAMAAVVLIAWVAYGHIERLSSTLADREMARIFDNARLGRAMSESLAQIDRNTRDCRRTPPAASEAAGTSLSELARRTNDEALAKAFTTLSESTQHLQEACRSVGNRWARIEAGDRELLEDIDRFEAMISRALIAQSLAGKSTEYLDQIMALTVGYRESVLMIAKLLAQQGAVPEHNRIISLLDDLHLRLQTMTVPSPEMTRLGRRMRDDVAHYQVDVRALRDAEAVFTTVSEENRQHREAVLSRMSEHDANTGKRAGDFREQLMRLNADTARQIAWIGAAIALLTLAFIAWFVRRRIERPLSAVLTQIATIRRGEVAKPILQDSLADEWGTIQRSLEDMAHELAKANDQLKEAITEQRTLIAALPDIVMRFDDHGRHIFVSDNVSAVVPMSASDFIGKTHRELGFPGALCEFWDQAIKHVFSTREPLESEFSFTRPNGDTRIFSWRLNPDINDSGNVRSVLAIACDITEQRQSERRFALAMNASKILTWEMDFATGKLAYDGSAMSSLGLDKANAPDSLASWMARVHPDDLELFKAKLAQVLQADDTRGFECDYRLSDTSGLYHWLQTVGQIVLRAPDGQPLQAAGYSVNIDERKAAEAELVRHRDHLEQEVLSRTADLVDAKLAAEAANRAKSAFLANMSHELRTPMNGVLGMIELAIRRMADPVGQDKLDKAKASAERLLGVLNDILDISKIEAEHMVLEDRPLQLTETLDNLRATLDNKASEKGLHLAIDLPAQLAQIRLAGDPLRLEQILINLVGNAIKFTDRGEIVVRARQINETPVALQVRFEITDTGIGIDAKAQTRLFNSFEQADNSMTRKYGGTGLGLAISKRLVQMMGGVIGVESTLGQGSTFWFVLPLKKREESARAAIPVFAAPAAEQRLQAEHAGARTLIAEDEPVNREIALALLEGVGLAVDLAEDGQQALELARQHRYALILMDMQMPVMNGIEATQAIRADSLNRTTPILAMTANAFDEDRKACIDAGMNEHIPKPVDPDRLFQTTLKWLEKHIV